jgi:hypothetical protein
MVEHHFVRFGSARRLDNMAAAGVHMAALVGPRFFRRSNGFLGSRQKGGEVL